MLFTKESLDNLKEAIDINIVLEIIDIKTDDDDNYLCPFCGSSKFLVNYATDICGCIDCKFYGGVIELLMHVNEISFAEAVKTLAEIFDVNLEEIKQKAKDKCLMCESYKTIIKDLLKQLALYKE